MSESEESPAQRQARIRREKREAKIKSGGQERLDRITQLSGRTAENMRNPDSPVATPPRTASPAMPPAPTAVDAADPEQIRQQEEFLKALLRGQSTQQQQGPSNDPEDPMLKMLTSMLGGMNDDPNAPNGGIPSFNPDDLAKATGLPSFVTNMMMGKQDTPISPAEEKEQRLWRMLHVIVAVIVGIYLLFTVDKLTGTFGLNPPAPATVQNPFVIFVMAELLLHGVKPFLSSRPAKGGIGFWFQTAKDIGKDGAIMVFLMGAYNWWYGLA